jgi:hypothetical protein
VVAADIAGRPFLQDVFFLFPKHDEEDRLLAEYHAEDAA